MAILNGGLLGTSRNKVGGIVSYRLRGQTVAREYVTNVANPRSAAQMVQRAKLINLVAAYRANRFWMNSGAFESKKQTWSDYNAFVSANTLLNPVYMTRPMVAAGAGIVQAYQVTRGSLPTIQTTWEPAVNSVWKTDLQTGTFSIGTVAELSTALIANNNGIREGDQLSFIVNFQRVGNNGYPYILARAYELILNTTDTRTLANIVPDVVPYDYAGDGIVLCWETAAETELVGAAIILSRDSSGQIAVSNQNLVLTPAMQQFVSQWQTAAAYQAYAASYGEGDTNFLAGGYSGITSNPDVPLSLQVTRAWQGTATANVGGDGITIVTTAPLNIELSGTVDSVEDVFIAGFDDLDSTTEVQLITGATIVEGNRVQIPTSQLVPLQGRQLVEFRATINGADVQATWRSTTTPGGDVS